MARLHIHPVGLGLLFFGLISWVIALGGLGASTAYCKSQDDNVKPEVNFSCAQAYQQDWWSLFFEFFLLLIMLFTCFTNAFERGRFIFLTYLAMVTVLLTITATNFCTASFQRGIVGFGDKKSDAYNAAAAGAILLCITNYLLIIFVGLGAAGSATTGGYQNVSYLGPLGNIGMTGFGSANTGAATTSNSQMLGVGASSAPVDKYQPSNF